MTVVQFQGKTGGKNAGAPKGGLVAALDIGSTKISCLIAEAVPARHRIADNEDRHNLKILGVGHQISRGVRSMRPSQPSIPAAAPSCTFRRFSITSTMRAASRTPPACSARP